MPRKIKIHIFGASGSGVSTLGKTLALNLQIPFYDADDFYWKKSDPPFREATPILERKILIKNAVSVSIRGLSREHSFHGEIQFKTNLI